MGGKPPRRYETGSFGGLFLRQRCRSKDGLVHLRPRFSKATVFTTLPFRTIQTKAVGKGA